MQRINVEGHGLVDFPDDMTRDQIARAIETELVKAKAPVPEAPPVPQGGSFVRGVGAYLPQTKGTIAAAQALLGKAIGSESMTEAGVNRYLESEKAMQGMATPEEASFTDAYKKGVGAVVTDYLPYQIGQGVSNLIETVATSVIGGMLGTAVGPEGTVGGAITGFVGKNLVKQKLKDEVKQIIKDQGEEAAKKHVAEKTAEFVASKEGRREINKYVGATAGLGTTAVVRGMGEPTGQAIQENVAQGRAPGDIDTSRLLPAAAVHSAADFVVSKITLGALDGIGENAGRSLVYDIFKRIGVTGTKELAPEEIQTMAERYGARLSLADADAMNDYINTAAASYAMSVVPGGIGGAKSYLAARPAAAENLLQQETQNQEVAQTEAVSPNVQAMLDTLEEQKGKAKKTKSDVGANVQPGSLEIPADATPELAAKIEEYNKRQAEIDVGTNKNKINNQIKKNETLLAKIKADTTQKDTVDGDQTESGASGKSDVISGRPIDGESISRTGELVGDRVVRDGSDVGAAEVGTDALSTALDTETAAKTKPVYRKQSDETSGAEKISFEKKVAKPIKAVGPVTKEPSAQNYLNKNALYGESAPLNVENGIKYAARDHAFDIFDSIDYENGVVPAIQAKMDAHNTKQEKEHKVLQAQLEEKGTNPKEIETTLNSKFPLYEAVKDAPKFMSMDEIVDVYKKHSGKKEHVEGGKARKDHIADREAFVQSLNPFEQLSITRNKDSAFEQEVLTDITSRETSADDKRKAANREKVVDAVKNISIEDEYNAIVKELGSITEDKSQQALDYQIAQHTQDVEAHSRVHQAISEDIKNTKNAKLKKALTLSLATIAVERDTSSKKLAEARSQRRRSSNETKANALRERLAELETQLDEEAKADKAAVKETPPAKTLTGSLYTAGQILNKTQSKLKEALQTAVNGKQKLSEILNIIANERLNYFSSQQVAKSILSVAKKSGLDLKAKIVIGELPANKDGKFDPATNTITLKGENGVYSGKRKIERVIMHEIMHYLTDHVTSNRAAYIKSLPVEQREAATAALNRLDRNFRFAKAKLGRKYHIASMKEFIAEAYSNASFQGELAKIEERGIARGIANTFYDFVKNIVSALGIDRVEYGATLQEVLEDVASIISIPKGKLKGKEVSYATSKAKPKVIPAPKVKTRKVKLGEYDKAYDPKVRQATTSPVLGKSLMTVPGWQRVARTYQNKAYPLKVLQRQIDMAGLLVSDIRSKINNIYTQLVLSSGQSKVLFKQYAANHIDELNVALNSLSKAFNLDVARTMQEMHKIFEALHEQERRTIKYILKVPLSNTINLKFNGKPISAADLRQEFINKLKTEKLNKADAEALRKALNKIIFKTNKNGDVLLDANNNPIPNDKYVDVHGTSPSGRIASVDIAHETYNVTGMDIADRNSIISEYEKHPNKAEIDKVIKSIKELNKATITLNKMGNYFSDKVGNFVNFYGWDNYVPLKGIVKHSDADEYLNYSDKRLGAELQNAEYTYEGRETVSEDPIPQIVTDVTMAALRAGRREYTQTIKNLLIKDKLNPEGQGTKDKPIINGKVIAKIPFENREELTSKYKGKKNILFHYNEDGSVDILEIQDDRMLEAIRGTYRASNPMLDTANAITSGLGTLHTRYNYNFAALNFVRDALTNMWTIGAEMGPRDAARFLKAVSAEVVFHGGLSKALKISYAYAKNDFKAIEQYKNSDPYMKDMVEYIEAGGLVSYLQSLSNKNNYEELKRQGTGSDINKRWQAFNKGLDVWVEMFEIASRTAAYKIKKQSELDKGKSEESAKTEAAAYAKNLANFEEIGELGKEMGALFMFFRPSATGAVRAIEAVSPAWMNEDQAVLRLPANIRENPKAQAEYRKNFKESKKNAKLMSVTLVGLGLVSYVMSAMTADDDDLGRNSTLNDNMDQWTRFARFHIGDDIIIQAPWGFGLGALAALGPQIAAVGMGKQSVADGLGNLFQIGLDSFIPIPFSRMSPVDEPLAFAIDSLMPSAARPLVEFAMNKNGLGQNIYNDSNRRMGDAYSGGDKIPQNYKDLAQYMFDNLGVDISPNTLAFLANSYADGAARVVDETRTLYDLAEGNKSFVAKTDLPLFGSFFGAKANVDSMEFTKVSREIEDMQKKLNMVKDHPEAYANYINKNPTAELIVDMYNESINDKLKDLRQQANDIRGMEVTQKDKTELLKSNILMQSIVKRNLIEQFKAYGVEY